MKRRVDVMLLMKAETVAVNTESRRSSFQTFPPANLYACTAANSKNPVLMSIPTITIILKSIASVLKSIHLNRNEFSKKKEIKIFLKRKILKVKRMQLIHMMKMKIAYQLQSYRDLLKGERKKHLNGTIV